MVLLFSSKDMELFRKRLSVYGSYCPSALERLCVLSMVGFDKLIWVTVVGLAGMTAIESEGWKSKTVQQSKMRTEKLLIIKSYVFLPPSLACLFPKRFVTSAFELHTLS